MKLDLTELLYKLSTSKSSLGEILEKEFAIQVSNEIRRYENEKRNLALDDFVKAVIESQKPPTIH